MSNLNDRETISREIEQAQADIGMLERIQSAPQRLRDLLARKKVDDDAGKTEEEKRARAEAARLPIVHATGALVDAAVDALVAAVKAAEKAQADFWAVTRRADVSSKTAPANALKTVIERALHGYPEGVPQMHYSDYLPPEPGKRPRYQEVAYAQSPKVQDSAARPAVAAEDSPHAARAAHEKAHKEMQRSLRD